jgi:diguanylate cyclase (GGDEF)-like protein/PAS domain S-box-containing protein
VHDAQSKKSFARAFRSAGFPFAIAILCAVAALSYERIREFQTDVYWRGHTNEVLQHIERTQTALLGAESMRRAFRLSRAAGDLEQMESRIATATRELDDVEKLTVDNRSQQVRVRDLRPMIAERVAILHYGIDLANWEELDAATRDGQRARQAQGSDLTKRMTSAIDAMRAEEVRLLAEREARALKSAAGTEATLVYGSGVGILLMILMYGSLARENRARLVAQRDLARANGLFNAVVEGTTDVIAVKDTAGHYMLINSAGCRNLGRTPAEVIGKTDRELLTGGTGESVMAADAAVLRRGETTTFEQVASVGDRTWTFHSTKGPYRGPTGEVLGVIAVSRDISERKRMEQRILDQNIERGEIIERLERQSAELAALSEMATLLQSTHAMEEVLDLIAHFATRLFAPRGVLGIIPSSRERVEPAIQWGGESPGASFALSECWALRTGRAHASLATGPACTHLAPDSRPSACIPLIAHGTTIGVLQLRGEPPEGQLLGAFSEQIALALTNLRLEEALREQAMRDPLTNLYNRRYMDETLARELARVGRKGAPLSLVMIDIDHFKRLNDMAGHAAGDAVLKRVARQLMSGVRREDVACRFGGEEFALVLPELTLDGAAERAESLRREIEAAVEEVAGKAIGSITASFGVACFPAHGSSGDELVRAADAALYQAKTRGRNRVVVAHVVTSVAEVVRSGVAPSGGERRSTVDS